MSGVYMRAKLALNGLNRKQKFNTNKLRITFIGQKLNSTQGSASRNNKNKVKITI